MKKVEKFLDLKNVFLFGLFKGSAMSEDDDDNDNFDDFKNYTNTISKKDIIKHIEQLDFHCLAPMQNHDIFTGKLIANAGFYKDGDFVFPTDFLHYLKNYDIGVPPEYEEYLKKFLHSHDEK